MRMLAYNLTSIHFFLREDKELTTILQFIDGIGKSCSAFHRNHGAVGTTFYLTLIRLIFLETMSHDGFAGTSSQHISTQTNDTARRHVEFQVHTVTRTLHLHHFSLTASHHIDNLAGIFFGNVHSQFLDRFASYTVYLLKDNLRLTYL